VSRHEELEKILIARYEWDYAARGSKADCEKALWELVDKAIVGKNISRYDLLTTLHERYIAYKRDRRKKEKLLGVQRLQG
jgi:hypothetical protein